MKKIIILPIDNSGNINKLSLRKLINKYPRLLSEIAALKCKYLGETKLSQVSPDVYVYFIVCQTMTRDRHDYLSTMTLRPTKTVLGPVDNNTIISGIIKLDHLLKKTKRTS